MSYKIYCRYCQDSFEIVGASSKGYINCPRCHATISHYGGAKWKIQVVGEDSNEVQSVSEELVKKMSKQQKKSTTNNPWISGSFYLATAVVLVTLFLVGANTVPILVLPIVIVGALLMVSVVGAFQLRQDNALNQKNFLSLMLLTFKQLPFVRNKDKNENIK